MIRRLIAFMRKAHQQKQFAKPAARANSPFKVDTQQDVTPQQLHQWSDKVKVGRKSQIVYLHFQTPPHIVSAVIANWPRNQQKTLVFRFRQLTITLDEANEITVD